MKFFKTLPKWLLFPLIAIGYLVFKFFMDSPSQKGSDSLLKAKDKDKDLALKQQKANDEANKLREDSNKIEKEIEKISEDDDLDWHKKLK
jgi:hypothetical protein